MNHYVLVVDDEDTIRSFLKESLEKDGLLVEVASNVKEALATFSDKKKEFAAVVTDLRMLGGDGFSLIEKIKQVNSQVKFIIVTGFGVKEDVVKAIQYGIYDFFEKPFRVEEFNRAVRQCIKDYKREIEHQAALRKMETRLLRVEGHAEDIYKHVSKAQSMARVNETLTALRRDSMRGNSEENNVMIFGESGTGKQGVARMIHSGSRRAKGPWITLNCAGTKEHIQKELFGLESPDPNDSSKHQFGLLELASEGTLFLENVDRLDTQLQDQLQQALSQRIFRRVGGHTDLEVNVRVIATVTGSEGGFKTATRDGKFRQGLNGILSKTSIELPVLRERHEDIVDLAIAFAKHSFAACGKTFNGFGSDVTSLLKGYSWPGNLHELHYVMERLASSWKGNGEIHASALFLSSGNLTAAEAAPSAPKLQLVQQNSNGNPSLPAIPQGDVSYTDLKKQWCDSFEKEYLVVTLNRNGGNVSAAAREAKLDRSNFLRLLRRHGLKAQEYRKVEKAA